MKKFIRIFAVMTLLALVSVPVIASAAEKKVNSEVVMKVGNKLHLFHSGTADVKKEICIKDVIPVYRETGGAKNPQVKEVGAVKVLGYAGEHYFEAEVIKGEIKVGDIAKKEGAVCLVQPVK